MEVIEKSKCTGCMACRNACPRNAISIVEEDGFDYPQINENMCIGCNLCEVVCPINKSTKENKSEKKVYACKSKDDEIRMKSSSGGVFTVVAEEIIKNGGVVFGACFDEKFNVIHDYTEDLEGLEKFKGSKYVQSKIGKSFKKVREFLETERNVLFVSTPCQVEGLYTYLRKDYENLYTLDLICHGVPSRDIWRKYLEYRENKTKQIPTNINFREKKNMGWKDYEMKFSYPEGEDCTNHHIDPYMQLYLKNIALRESCYNCNFKKENRASDITIADFWGIHEINPEFYDEKGVSAIIVNSEKGRFLFDSIKNNLNFVEEKIDGILKYNYMLIKSVEENDKREEFLKDIKKLSFEEIIKKYL